MWSLFSPLWTAWDPKSGECIQDVHQPDLDPTRGRQRSAHHWLPAGEAKERHKPVDCPECNKWTHWRSVIIRLALFVILLWSCKNGKKKRETFPSCGPIIFLECRQARATQWRKLLREPSTSSGFLQSMSQEQGTWALLLHWSVRRIQTVSTHFTLFICANQWFSQSLFSISCCASWCPVRPCFKDPEDFIVVRAGNSVRVKICYEVWTRLQLHSH